MPIAAIRDKRGIGVAALSVLGLCLSACATQPNPPQDGDVPGFFLGLVQGFMFLFSLLASIFTNVRVYSFPNSGGWYDFGFVLGIAIFIVCVRQADSEDVGSRRYKRLQIIANNEAVPAFDDAAKMDAFVDADLKKHPRRAG